MEPAKTKLEIFDEQVGKLGSVDNYLRLQLLSNPNFVLIDDTEPDYEEKSQFQLTHTNQEYIAKYGGINPIVYKKLGLEVPKLHKV